MSEFVKIASVGELPDPGKRIFEVDERLVVLVLIDGEYYCIDDVCTHDGGTLGEGQLCGHALACPRHGAQFDVLSGAPLTMPATEATAAHEIKVESQEILVRIKDD